MDSSHPIDAQLPLVEVTPTLPSPLALGLPVGNVQTHQLSPVDFAFDSGIFTVGESGLVSVDFLLDGGAYAGELALFSLTGMGHLTGQDFIQEAAKRALTGSPQGHVVISDLTQGAKYDALLGEKRNRNQGTYLGSQTFEFDSGDQLGLMLVPHGTVEQLWRQPGATGKRQPLFSMGTLNPDDGFHLGQIADVTGEGQTFVMEDMAMTKGSDRDYNDLIFRLEGVTATVAAIDDQINPEQDWRQTAAGEELLNYFNLPVEPASGVKYQPYELLLKFPAGATDADIANLMAQYGATTIEYLVPPGSDAGSLLHQWRLVQFETDTNVLELQTQLAQDPRIVATDLNVMLSSTAIPNDPNFAQQWGLNNEGQTGGSMDADIDAPEAWNETTGSAEVIVAVLDTGIDYEHPDLKDNMWVNIAERDGAFGPVAYPYDDDGNGYVDDIHGYDFSDANITANNGIFLAVDTPRDTHGHGTHVAGIIGAIGNNNLGISGVSPNVSLMAVQMLSDVAGMGTVRGAALAIDYAINNGADIINASFGGYLGGWGRFVMADALQTAQNQDVLVVTAAGNHAEPGVGIDDAADAGGDNDARPFYPASFDAPNVIAVAATNHQDELADFSNYGATSVHLAAPGDAIWSTLPSEKKNTNIAGQNASWDPTPPEEHYGVLSGTSMATPHVTGAAALMLALNPELSASQLKNLLMTTVDPLDSLQGKTVTGGRLNLARAVAAAQATPPELTVIAPIIGANENQPFTIRHSDLFNNADLAAQGFTPADIQFRIESLGEDAPTQDGEVIPIWTTVLAEGDEVDWTPTVRGTAVDAFSVTAIADGVGSAQPVVVPVEVKQTIVSLEATDPDALEGADPAAFTISRTGNFGQPLTVSYALELDNYWPIPPAENGVDYQALVNDTTLTGTVTIPAGDASVTLPVTPVDDDVVEWPERVRLVLSEAIGYDVDENSRADITIWDNETPEIRVYAESIPGRGNAENFTSESGNTGQFVIRRLGSREEDLTVNYEMTGSATNGDDYEFLPGSTIIKSRHSDDAILFGADAPRIIFTPIDDNEVEGIEEAYFDVLESDDYAIVVGSRKTTLWDNDFDLSNSELPLVSFESIRSSIKEGETEAIVLTRTGDMSEALEVDIQVTPSAFWKALDNTQIDYELVVEGKVLPTGNALQVTIPAGASSQTIEVHSKDDDQPETVEAVVLQITSSLQYLTPEGTITTVRILDNDSLETVWELPKAFSSSANDTIVSISGQRSGDAILAGYAGNTPTLGIYSDANNDSQFSIPPVFLEDYVLQDTAVDTDGNLYNLAIPTVSDKQIRLLKYDLTTEDWSKIDLTVPKGLDDLTTTQSHLLMDAANNFYVATHVAGFQGASDVRIGKYDMTGQFIDSFTLGTGNSDLVHDMTLDDEDNLYLAGYTEGSFGDLARDGDGDVWVAKYRFEGNQAEQQWVKQMQTPVQDVAWGIAAHEDVVYVTGQTFGWLGETYGGDIINWTGNLTDYQAARYGNFSGFGGTYKGAGDAFIAQLNANTGSVNWKRLLGTTAEDVAIDVVADDIGGAYITGHTASQIGTDPHMGGWDVFAARYGVDGALQWQQQFGSLGDELLGDMDINAEDEIFLTGTTTGDFAGANQGGQDAWVMKLA